MHDKPFSGQALPGPTGGANSAPTDPLAGLRVWGLWLMLNLNKAANWLIRPA